MKKTYLDIVNIEEDVYNMRDRGYLRKMRNRAIHRKKNISHNIYGSDWYKNDGMYSKGKIHCSCPICKYSKVYDLPTHKTDLEDLEYKDALNDYYENT